MARKIRSDLEGVVSTYQDGVAITLAAGDDVPDGVEVGDHVLDGAEGDETEGQTGEPSKPAATAPKADWLAYSEHLGLDLDGSETTAQLKEKVEAAEREASEAAGS